MFLGIAALVLVLLWCTIGLKLRVRDEGWLGVIVIILITYLFVLVAYAMGASARWTGK